MRIELIDGTQTADKDTGWVEVGNENYVFTTATVNIDWTAASVTLDGQVDIYLSNNSAFLLANVKSKHTIAIDAATSVGKDNVLGIIVPFKYIRATFTLNSLTTVDLYVDIVYNKVKA